MSRIAVDRLYKILYESGKKCDSCCKVGTVLYDFHMPVSSESSNVTDSELVGNRLCVSCMRTFTCMLDSGVSPKDVQQELVVVNLYKVPDRVLQLKDATMYNYARDLVYLVEGLRKPNVFEHGKDIDTLLKSPDGVTHVVNFVFKVINRYTNKEKANKISPDTLLHRYMPDKEAHIKDFGKFGNGINLILEGSLFGGILFDEFVFYLNQELVSPRGQLKEGS